MNVAVKPLKTSLAPIGRLMLLDDAPFDHAAVRRAVERSGLVGEFVGFYMAEDALEYLGRKKRPEVDLLLVDLYLPRMGGVEFLAEAKARFGAGFARSIRFALTLSPDRDLINDIEALGIVDGWIEKPVRAEALHDLAMELA